MLFATDIQVYILSNSLLSLILNEMNSLKQTERSILYASFSTFFKELFISLYVKPF